MFRGAISRRLLHTSSSSLARIIPNRTRITKEISPEEVFRFQQQQQQQTTHTRFSLPRNTNGIITPQDPIYEILSQRTLVIERQIEFMNLFIGFEQANKYSIMNTQGERIGHMEEKDVGILKIIGRQFFRLHRPFTIDVFDRYGRLALTIKRPFSFINSHIKALLPGYDDRDNLMYEVVGESVQSWHLWRRRYNLFKLQDEEQNEYEQFGMVDAPFLSFDFPIRNEVGDVMASVDRNWVGLGRELFTDTGVYILRFDQESFSGVTGYGQISNHGY
ncbi:Altered inheritance rate of mitochondria protein 25 [Spathaspora sp. JA1]|nr:Altered inheritance rate of mitochondria protein 25 [Spathaspora sp. JA1]